MRDGELTGKLAVVTGGASGIGRATALGLARGGARVFVADIDDAGGAETCAAIGLVFWNHRLLQLDCDGRYGDAMERALYNGVVSGVSLDGTRKICLLLASNEISRARGGPHCRRRPSGRNYVP